MALQIPPLAFLALRYGAVALAGFAAARYAPRGRFSPAVTAEMDAAPSGVQVVKDDGELSASAKVMKDWRTGRFGPRFRVDATALARLRIRRVS
jgi:hypothetical protein